MSHPRRSQVPPVAELLLSDLVSLLLSYLPAGLAWALPLLGLRQLVAAFGPWAFTAAALWPLSTFGLLLVFLRCARLALPRLRPGSHRLGMGPGFVAWYLQLALARSLDLSGLSVPVRRSSTLSCMVYRALGAKIGRGVQIAPDAHVLDAPLVELGDGVRLGAGVTVSCHTMSGDRILLQAVRIESDASVAQWAQVGPGSRIRVGEHVAAGAVVSWLTPRA